MGRLLSQKRCEPFPSLETKSYQNPRTKEHRRPTGVGIPFSLSSSRVDLSACITFHWLPCFRTVKSVVRKPFQDELADIPKEMSEFSSESRWSELRSDRYRCLHSDLTFQFSHP